MSHKNFTFGRKIFVLIFNYRKSGRNYQKLGIECDKKSCAVHLKISIKVITIIYRIKKMAMYTVPYRTVHTC